MSENLGWVGTSPPRRDLKDKVTGEAEYSADISFDDMLHAKVLRSPHPHAIIKSIRTKFFLAVIAKISNKLNL